MSTKSPHGIFIAEDNPADVRLILEALRTLQPVPEIATASDGDAVLLSLLNATKPLPALMFLDFNMPKTDSRTVLKRLRSEVRFARLAVVVLSSSDAEHAISEAYGLGADCYLSKPSDLEQFLATIRRAAEYWLGLAAHAVKQV